MSRRFPTLAFATVFGLAVLSMTRAGRARSNHPGDRSPNTVVGTREACDSNTQFLVGSGVYDITGPAARVGMMGYANPFQGTAGIHTRLRSRAFLIESPCNGKRVVFVSVDLNSVSHAVKHGVVQRLHAYNSVYSGDNVLISATHTHSGPGGFLNDGLYKLPDTPFNRQNYEAIVDGIFKSIVKAHRGLVVGRILVNSGELLGASINRSPRPYSMNGDANRVPGYDTDKLMTVLRLEDTAGRAVGMISWFSVHATSMSGSSLLKPNQLISADNKGYASYRFEKRMETRYDAGTTFVAAFAQSNEGDVSPNICNTDIVDAPVVAQRSSRDVLPTSCENLQPGGGATYFESTRLSGERQFEKAWELFEGATDILIGGVDYRHMYVRMDSVLLPPDSEGHPRRTWPAAIGLALLGGTPDGRSIFESARTGMTCEQFMSYRRKLPLLIDPRCQRRAAWDSQGVKPWVPVGTILKLWKRTLRNPEISLKDVPLVSETELSRSSPFPDTLPAQIVRIGDFLLVAVPFELTTMAGRRLRKTVDSVLEPTGIGPAVIAGLSNAYASYVTTPEEYGLQFYEGASTLFGQWTLEALLQTYRTLADSLRQGGQVETVPEPGDTVLPEDTEPTEYPTDETPTSVAFGEILEDEDAGPSYQPADSVCVMFWGGNPNNNLRTQRTFLKVQRKRDTSWVTVANDWDWETRYQWRPNSFPRRSSLCRRYLGLEHVNGSRRHRPCRLCSLITIEWAIPDTTKAGIYRICHYGDWGNGRGGIEHYVGTSREFRVEVPGQRSNDSIVASRTPCDTT